MKQFQVTEEKRELPWTVKKPFMRFYGSLKKLTGYRYPIEVAVCLTSRCNRRCDICARTHLVDRGLWEIVDIDWDLLGSVLRQIRADYGYARLMLGGEGEPLLYPRFDEFVEKSREILPDTPVTLYSNLSKLDEHYSIIGKFTTLVASLNFIEPEYYRKRTGVDGYYETAAKLREFLTVKGNRKPAVKIQLFTVTENMKRLQEFVDDWQPLLNQNDDFMLVDLHNFTHHVSIKNYYREPPKYERFPCRQPFLQLYVSASGHVYPCCMGSAIHNSNDEAMCLGHLNESSMKELVESDKLKQLRENHLNGFYLGTCRDCDVWKTFYNYFFWFNGRWW